MRLLLAIQASYILITGIWPLIHIESFMAITGYKTDIWLVKTVGALLIPIASCLFCFLITHTSHLPPFILGSFTAAAFAAIDFFYVFNNQISEVYLLDGAIELIFIAWWIVVLAKKYLRSEQSL